MSPLAKEIIEKLNKEEDIQVLAEVLDFYEYLKHKKNRELQRTWNDIDEDDASEDEKRLYEEYNHSKKDLTSLEDLVKELNLDEE